MFTKEKVIEQNAIHREDIKIGIDVCKSILSAKSASHDLDKNDPTNAQFLAIALNCNEWDEWNKIHMLKQRHHIECFHTLTNGSLFDLMEMAVDNCVANLRRTGEKRTFESEFKYYQLKGFDEQMSRVMANTFIVLQGLISLEE